MALSANEEQIVLLRDWREVSMRWYVHPNSCGAASQRSTKDGSNYVRGRRWDRCDGVWRSKKYRHHAAFIFHQTTCRWFTCLKQSPKSGQSRHTLIGQEAVHLSSLVAHSCFFPCSRRVWPSFLAGSTLWCREEMGMDGLVHSSLVLSCSQASSWLLPSAEGYFTLCS